MKTTILLKGLLAIAMCFVLVSCQKDDDEPEKIISTQEVVRNGNVIVEASYRNELRKMYFILVSPNSAVVTRATDFDSHLTNQEYYRKVIIPSEFEHMSQTYIVVGIKENAFLCCDKLTSVVMPNTICSVGNRAFLGCSVLTSVICHSNTPPCLGYDVFLSCPIEEIKVPQASVEAYRSSDGWKEFSNKIVGY
jgi:hypothetical protein